MILKTKELSIHTYLLHFCLVPKDIDHLVNRLTNVKNLDILPEVLLFLLQHGVIQHVMNEEIDELCRAPDLV